MARTRLGRGARTIEPGDPSIHPACDCLHRGQRAQLIVLILRRNVFRVPPPDHPEPQAAPLRGVLSFRNPKVGCIVVTFMQRADGGPVKNTISARESAFIRTSLHIAPYPPDN